MALPLTWLGHASFRFDVSDGRRFYVDPWLVDNPSCPHVEVEPERIDVILLTHGHVDHVADVLRLWQEHRPTIVAPLELRGWLERQGVDEDLSLSPNRGGTVKLGGVNVTLTDARHSSASPQGEYLGEPCGLVVDADEATVYFAGDTMVFGDMQLIARLFDLDAAVLPIGGHFTMDPRQAALALELLGEPRCIPCHYGTFPLLKGTPEQLRASAPMVEVLVPEPGETVLV